MDVSDLRIFEAVARLATMNHAAHELNTVQSNVTARIRLLEESVGTALFLRHSRGVALTTAGQRLLPYARQVIQLMDEARSAVADDGTPGGRLSLGSLETTAMLRLPDVLARYAAAYPTVDLALTTGTTGELVGRVLERRLEGAFVCGPVDHPELVEDRIYREELVLVTAPTLRRLGVVLRQRDLKIVVLRSGCSYRQRLEGMLAKRGVVGLRHLEFGTLDAIVGCVSAGIGITLLPRSVITAAHRQGRVAIHRLPSDEAQVDTVFIRRRDLLVSSALRAFIAYAGEPSRVRVAKKTAPALTGASAGANARRLGGKRRATESRVG